MKRWLYVRITKSLRADKNFDWHFTIPSGLFLSEIKQEETQGNSIKLKYGLLSEKEALDITKIAMDTLFKVTEISQACRVLLNLGWEPYQHSDGVDFFKISYESKA